MFGPVDIFQPVWTQLATPLNAATQDLIAGLMGYLGPVLMYGVPAYLTIMLMIAAWSSDETAYQRFFKQLWLAAVIYTLAATTEPFNYYVVGVANGFVAGVSQAIATGLHVPAAVTAETFDIFATKMFMAAKPVVEAVSFYSPKTWFNMLLVIIYIIIGLASIFVMFFEFLAGYLVQSLFLGFGPLFVAAFFFPFTRRFFNGWVSVVAAAMLTQIFVVGLLAMFMDLITRIVTGFTGPGGLTAVDQNANMAALAFLLLMVGILSGVFGTLTVYFARIAVHIASAGFAFQRGDVPVVPQPTMPYVPAMGGSSGGGGSANAGGGPVSDPGRVYAFNRTVGSAP